MVKEIDAMGDVSTGEQEVERPKRKVPPIRVWVTDSIGIRSAIYRFQTEDASADNG